MFTVFCRCATKFQPAAWQGHAREHSFANLGGFAPGAAFLFAFITQPDFLSCIFFPTPPSFSCDMGLPTRSGILRTNVDHVAEIAASPGTTIFDVPRASLHHTGPRARGHRPATGDGNGNGSHHLAMVFAGTRGAAKLAPGHTNAEPCGMHEAANPMQVVTAVIVKDDLAGREVAAFSLRKAGSASWHGTSWELRTRARRILPKLLPKLLPRTGSRPRRRASRVRNRTVVHVPSS